MAVQVDPERGFAVARLGLPHHHAKEWPIFSQGRRIFVTGHPAIHTSGPTLSGFYGAVSHSDRTVTIQTDRTGSHRIFYGIWEKKLYFAPEIKALLSVGASKEIDLAAFGTFLASGFLYRDQTLLKQVRRLPVFSKIIINNASICYRASDWLLQGRSSRDPNPNEVGDEFAEIVRSAADQHFGEPSTTALFLSGGLDSRVILAATLAGTAFCPDQINAVTWSGGQRGPGSDSAVASEVAKLAGVRHELITRQFDDYEPWFRRVNALIDGGSEIVAQHCDELRVMQHLFQKGILRCIRGDHLFYRYKPPTTHEEAWRSTGLRRLLHARTARALIASDKISSVVEASQDVFDDISRRYSAFPPAHARPRIYLESRLPNYLHGSTYWRQSLFDQRSIFLDDRVLDFIATIPPQMWTKDVLYASLLDRRFGTVKRAIPYPPVDWKAYLSPGQSAGRYFRFQVSDTSSGVWQYLNRKKVTQLMHEFDEGWASRTRRATRVTTKRILKGIDTAASFVSPTLAASVKRTDVHADALLRRTIVFKQWYDEFIEPNECNS